MAIKIRKRFIIAVPIILLIGLLSVYISAEKTAEEYEDMQIRAAERMENAEAYLKERVLSLGFEIEAEDLNQTGLLGPEFTELTSTPGDENAKRSTLNPLFASAMIRYFYQAGLKKGDTIAIGATGSFPGFVIASLTAATEMGLHTELIASVGASMHGATRVDYNIFDIVEDLKKGGFADFDLLAVSPGSVNDRGGGILEGMFYEGSAELSLKLCEEAAEETGAEVIFKDTLEESIQRRLELYSDDVKLFINVGGASVNNGTSSYSLAFPRGLVLDPPKIPDTPNRGLNYEFAARGIPVINLLSVKQLCQDNNIAFDPVPLPSVFNGEKLENVEYNKGLAIATIILAFAVLIWGVIDGKRRTK